jgi:hypothetical protein
MGDDDLMRRLAPNGMRYIDDGNRIGHLDQMKERNPSSADSSEDEEVDPEGFFMQFWIVCQLSIGPIISMIFYMAV